MNNGNSGSLGGHNGDDSGIYDQDGNPGETSGHSSNSADASAQAENRRRISISEYKQRGKKPEEAALNTSASNLNNNDINFRMAPNPPPPPAPAPPPVRNPPHQNGQIVFNSIEDYYAHIYCLSNQGQLPTLSQVQAHLHPQVNPPLPSMPAPAIPEPPPSTSYPPYWGQPPQPPPRNSIDSRMHKVDEWITPNSRFLPSKCSFQVSMHNGESPTPRFPPPPPQEKTPKITRASDLNDPSQATSFAEWRKRKYGTEDAPTPTSTNSSKFRRTDSWRDKGGPRNDRRGRQGQKNQGGWDNSASGSGSGAAASALDSWDDDSTVKPQSSGNLESWDDEAPAPAASNQTLDSWDDGPAPEPNKNLQSNLDSWDDDTPAPVANKNLENLESWDDDTAAPGPSAVPPSVQSIPESWDNEPPRNYGSWEAGSAQRKPKPMPKAAQNGLESWDDDEAPPVPSANWGNTSAPPPPKPSQDGLESWDDEAPAPQASNEVLDSWDDNPPPPPPANPPPDSWDSGNQPSRSNGWGSNRSQRNFRDNRNYGNNSRNDSNHRSRSGSRDNSEPHKFRRDYRGGSRSSDNSDSGYSNRQGFRGNRGRQRSDSRESGNWGRNNSRDRSENRPWNNRNNFGDRNNDRRNSRSSWGQPEPPPAPPADTTGESWDDDVPTPQPSQQFPVSWGRQKTSQNAQDSWDNSSGQSRNYGNSSGPAEPLSAEGLESWDDDVPPPEARKNPEEVPPAAQNAGNKMSDMVRALCTTCSFEIIHRCKFEKDSSTNEELKPGELFTCTCGMAFLHERECIHKVGESYAPITMETSLMKQVGRSHVYLCKVCDFKFVIENLKDGSHFFKQMTNKKGDKIRQGTTINDPVGLEAFTFHIERVNNIACLGAEPGIVDASFKHKMASICQCNQGCCTIYHECEAYSGLLEEGETL
ncbi:nucleolar protein dao-5 isoform X2 [Diachasma alloeum]|uniref:nucleolar protein dao-5 isoform X2 n=1 Tax=Diachasma alloeum TaxID=454923 RepID=UPI0007381F89|nr:nucleolar protein dao-5 isoform X2 [Diachasma alloeum]